MRRNLLFFLIALMAAFSASADSITEFVYDGLNYRVLSDGTAIVITGSYSLHGYTEVTIHEKVTNKDTGLEHSVCGILGEAFKDCTSLKTVNLPATNTITYIGDDAFFNCKNLAKFTGYLASTDNHCLVLGGELLAFARKDEEGNDLTSYSIPDGITSIGANAFNGCTSLTSVTLPETVTAVGEKAFYGCSSLTTFNGIQASDDKRCLIVTDPELKAQKLVAFAYSGLTEYEIPSTVQKIANSVFLDCSALTSVTFPESLISISYYAFKGCSGLTSLTFPSKIKFIYEFAFQGCDGLTEVTIPGTLELLEGSAFMDCSNLTTATFDPEFKVRIPMFLFQNCMKLNSVSIPDNITEIGAAAFYNTPYITMQLTGMTAKFFTLANISF